MQFYKEESWAIVSLSGSMTVRSAREEVGAQSDFAACQSQCANTTVFSGPPPERFGLLNLARRFGKGKVLSVTPGDSWEA